jgi:hypothetical protein
MTLQIMVNGQYEPFNARFRIVIVLFYLLFKLRLLKWLQCSTRIYDKTDPSKCRIELGTDEPKVAHLENLTL